MASTAISATTEPGYRIRIEGHLDARWLAAFEQATALLPDRGDSLLIAAGADQSALLCLLRRIHNLGLRLLTVELLPSARGAGRLARSNDGDSHAS